MLTEDSAFSVFDVLGSEGLTPGSDEDLAKVKVTSNFVFAH
jgi:hypothetical protein